MANSESVERIALTVTAAAQAACVSRPTLYQWMHLPGFPVVRIGGCVRIPAKAFERWLEERAGV